MLLTNNTDKVITDISQLNEVFQKGCKSQENIGVESEKLLIYKENHKAIKYEDAIKILKSFDENTWERLYEGENIIGLKSNFAVISLEPGSQIEISLIPYDNIDKIANKLNEFYTDLSRYADNINAIVLDSGIQPVSTYEDIEVIPKKRYEYMTKYLPSKNLSPFIMMRETAGIQANFDYKTEEDAMKKLSVSLKLSPIISAIYSNSPIRNDKLTDYKSYRANAWLNVDEERCGLINKKLFDKSNSFSFLQYTEILLDVPMIYIQKHNKYFYTTKTFREFINEGYEGFKAEQDDWLNHISLYFPDVRLKNYIEIRNHDAQNKYLTYSVPAFWKGIIYNPDAIDEIEKILSTYTYEDFMTLRKDTPKYGINAKLNKYSVIEFVKEFFDISYSSLKANNNKEEKYLEPVYEYINQKRMPCDDLIDNFQKNQISREKFHS